MRRRRIKYMLAVCATASIGFSPPVLAGPYSSGLANTTVGAVDPGIPGFVSSAVNPVFVGWATGYTSYLPAPGVDSGWNDPTMALGPVTGDNFSIVSLGDLSSAQIAAGTQPGRITLSFNSGIRNGSGADFAVFENGFGSNTSVFGELGYVEVSSDGTHFARFPNDSLTPSAVGAFGNINPTNVHNLAGKHVNAFGNSYGTPFDLGDLTTDPLVTSGQVKLNAVKYVRIVDIPGNGSFLDSSSRPIYDAWQTVGSGGLDLEAIGVTNAWLGGDANLDGSVNIVDAKILADNWGKSGMDFSQGNFDLIGTVDVGDLSILAKNWQGGGASLGPLLASLGIPAPAVPEPTSLGFITIATAFLNVRTRSATKMEGRKSCFVH